MPTQEYSNKQAKLFWIILEDTSVTAIASAVSHKCDDPVFLYKKEKLFDCNALCTDDVNIQLHAYLQGVILLVGFSDIEN